MPSPKCLQYILRSPESAIASSPSIYLPTDAARSSRPFYQILDKDNNLVGFKTNGYEISLQSAEEKFKSKQVKKELTETLKGLKAKGVNAEDLEKAIKEVFGAENTK